MGHDQQTILLVEFNSELRHELARFLNSKNFEVVEAQNGQAAQIAISRCDASVVVIDRVLPRGEDGFELIPTLRALCSSANVPVIVLDSSPPDEETSKRAAKMRRVAFVLKPVDPPELLGVVTACAATRQSSGIRPAQNLPACGQDPLADSPRTASKPPPRRPQSAPRPAVEVDISDARPLERPKAPKLRARIPMVDASPSGLSRRPSLIPIGRARWPAGQTAKFTFERHQMPTKGSLEEWNIAELIYSSFVLSFTGKLKFWDGALGKEVYISKGFPVFVNSRLPEETLGAFLLRQGTLTDEQHQDLTREMLARGCRLGELLISYGILSPHELSEAITAHLAEKISSLFSWEQGNFELLRGTRFLADVFTFKMEPARVVLDGVQRHFSATRVAAEFPLPDEAVPFSRRHTSRRIPNLPLNTHEARVFRFVGREMKLRNIVEEAGTSREDVVRILYSFYVMELIGIQIGQRDQDTNPRAAKKTPPRRQVDSASRMAALVDEKEAPSPLSDSGARPMTSARRMSLERELRADHARLINSDYFTVLGLRPTSNIDEIRHAFRVRVENLRPHMLVGLSPEARAVAQELYQRVTEAYLVLEDADLRQRYVESHSRPTPATIQAKRREQADRNDTGSFQVLLETEASSLYDSFFGDDGESSGEDL